MKNTGYDRPEVKYDKKQKPEYNKNSPFGYDDKPKPGYDLPKQRYYKPEPKYNEVVDI